MWEPPVYKPNCYQCNSKEHVVESSTGIASEGDKFWYCRKCKVEVDPSKIDYGFSGTVDIGELPEWAYPLADSGFGYTKDQVMNGSSPAPTANPWLPSPWGIDE